MLNKNGHEHNSIPWNSKMTLREKEIIVHHCFFCKNMVMF